jgi:hypothetical protein
MKESEKQLIKNKSYYDVLPTSNRNKEGKEIRNGF